MGGIMRIIPLILLWDAVATTREQNNSTYSHVPASETTKLIEARNQFFV